MRKIVVKLMGGLGNQMFQISAAKKVCSIFEQDFDIIFDTNFLNDRTTNCVHRNFDLDVFSKINYSVSDSPNQAFDKIVFDDDNIETLMSNAFIREKVRDSLADIYLSGYFQNHKYILDEMADLFALEKFSSEESCNFFNNHFDHDSLMINVRRGDYVSRPDALAFHGFLGETYIRSALSRFSDHEYSNVLVFSDEPDWCKKNLGISDSIVVDHAYAGHKFADYLHMMTKFRNMIIPNSTFAWWAAWLSEKRGTARKVVCPGKTLWFSNNPNKASLVLPTTSTWQYVERKDLT